MSPEAFRDAADAQGSELPPAIKTPPEISTPNNRGPGVPTQRQSQPTATAPTSIYGDDSAELMPAVPEFDTISLLGRGGMGSVYLVRDRGLERLVALKIIRTANGLTDADLYRFQQEALALGRLNHPNIVTIYGQSWHRAQPYFTMKYAAGGSLHKRVGTFVYEPRRAVELMEKVARAVDYLHQRGIVHRDLKPSNILLDEGDEPLISDFGIAKFTDTRHEFTHTGAILGTRQYMAPEQALGQNDEVGPSADIWALGVILYELLAGVRPFPGETHEAVTRSIVESYPVRPRKLMPQIDAALETIILKCLRKSPSHRYSSAAALADDLRHWMVGNRIKARPESAARQLFSRHPAIAAVLVFLVGTGGLAAAVAPYFDADRPLREAARRLARGETVWFIGESGPPAWYRWVPDMAGIVAASGPDQAFRIDSVDRALLQLSNDLPASRYRFRAEVRHCDCTPPGRVGLYFGQRRISSPAGVQNVFYTVDFAEHPPTVPFHAVGHNGEKIGLVLMNFTRVTRANINLGVGPSTCQLAGVDFTIAPRPQWHALTVEVTPETVLLSEGGNPPFQTTWEKLTESELHQYKATNQPVNDVAEFGRNGPGTLGLYCVRGAAEFRNVAVEPLP